MGHPPCVESVITAGQPASTPPDSMETAAGDGSDARGWDPIHVGLHRHNTNTCPDCTSIGELKNLVINYHLQSYVMDISMVFFFI